MNAAAVEAASGGWFDPSDAAPTIEVAMLRVLEDDSPGAPLSAAPSVPHAERPSAPPGAAGGGTVAATGDAPQEAPQPPPRPGDGLAPGILNLMTMIRDVEQ